MRNLMTLLAVAALVLAGCGKKKEEKAADKPAASEAGEKAEQPGLRPSPEQIKARQATRPALLPITVDEVKEMVPALEGRVTKPLAKAQVGEIVQAAWCYDSGEVAEISEKVKEKLAALGWLNVTVRMAPNAPVGKERAGLTGVKKPYLVFGSVQRGPWPDCSGDKGQTYVQLNVRKQEDRPAGAGAPMAPVGPGGVGRPLPMPRPVVPANPNAPAPAPQQPAPQE